ncbi:uncharacterized protein LOC135483562 isoform X2 [Lineus longissimus]|uniref:uncharacterized protein LOC135483562 isoform X2 n=1 Tax=Lineus longissimus TaxID=88925 RepID=UPI00315CC927
MDDLFRSFFGLSRRGNNERDYFGDIFHGTPHFGQSDSNDIDDDECCQGDIGEEGEMIFGSVPGMPDVNTQFDFSQADDMFRHFEEMFKTFGMVELPSSRHFAGPDGNSNLRDRMLKDGVEDAPDNKVDTLPSDKRTDTFEAPSIFGNIWKTPRWDRIRPDDKIDKDLDGELGKDDFDRIASESKKSEPSSSVVMPSGTTWGFSKSVSVRSTRRGDGTVEHVKTVRNSDGSEEKTVTREIDNKSYSVVTKRNKDGEKEKMETFRNIDEKSLEDFNKKWTESGQRSISHNELVLSDHQDNESKSMFSKFFGSLPGFRSS